MINYKDLCCEWWYVYYFVSFQFVHFFEKSFNYKVMYINGLKLKLQFLVIELQKEISRLLCIK